MPFLQSKFCFYAKNGEQNPLRFLVISENQDQNQRIVKKWERSVHVQSGSTKVEILKS